MFLTDPTAVENMATALGNNINSEAMFSNVSTLIPVIGGVLIFSFTYYIVRRIVKKAQKGKAGI